jgi:hypothetical protein
MIISEDQFRLRQRFEDIELGRVIPQFFLRPCRLKILMVVDGFPGSFLNVSYSHSYFGLSAVLDTLRDNPEHFVKFDVTRAHRQTDTFKPNPATDPDLHDKYGPHFENFVLISRVSMLTNTIRFGFSVREGTHWIASVYRTMSWR